MSNFYSAQNVDGGSNGSGSILEVASLSCKGMSNGITYEKQIIKGLDW